LPTIVKLAVFFYPGKRHRSNHPSCSPLRWCNRVLPIRTQAAKAAITSQQTSTRPDQAGCGSLFASPCGGNPFISNKTLAKINGSQNSIGIARFLIQQGSPEWDRRTLGGTARSSAMAPSKGPTSAAHPIQYSEFPHPEYRRGNK
jgi:hypothetical protein